MEDFYQDFAVENICSIEDEKFDRIYPARLRHLSSVQWTPVRIAAEAAKLLLTAPYQVHAPVMATARSRFLCTSDMEGRLGRAWDG